MIKEENVIVLDIDGTICEIKDKNDSYKEVKPKYDVVKKLKQYRDNGFYIILFTSRQMRTYKGNIGRINANTAKVLFTWLDEYDIPYDEVHFAKPWCGRNGFYVDDKAIRPSEFVDKSHSEIMELLKSNT
jgi:capsule biosynthesis phosphatase